MSGTKSKYLILIVVLAAAVGFVLLLPRDKSEGNFDAFAQCLAEKKVTMYGADWCAHCQKEKAAFGESFRFVPYVECSTDPQKCLAAGITGYPTWVLPDGKRLEGEQGLEKLSQESGCSLHELNN